MTADPTTTEGRRVYYAGPDRRRDGTINADLNPRQPPPPGKTIYPHARQTGRTYEEFWLTRQDIPDVSAP